MAIDPSTLRRIADLHVERRSEQARPAKRRWNPFAGLLGTRSQRSVASAPTTSAAVSAPTAAPASAPAIASRNLSAAITGPDVPGIAPAPSAPDSAAVSIRDATRAERARCARIIKAGIASGQINAAASIAFKSDLDADTALASLKAAELDRQEAARTRVTQRYEMTAPTREKPQTATAEQIIAAGKKRRSEL